LLGFVFRAAAGQADGEDPFADIRQEESQEEGPQEEPPPSGLETVTRNLQGGLELFGRLQVLDDASRRFQAGLGVDLYTQVVTRSGTWGTSEVQLRLIWDQQDKVDFEAHSLYLEKRFLYGRLNLLAGHFQLPFNLEALPIDTHTTLSQLSNPAVLGLKHDWGIALRGQLSRMDYDLAYTIGSGMDLVVGAAGLVTARAGWRSGADWFGFGLSAMGGERLLPGMSGREQVSGWRVGADLTSRVSFLRFLAEASAGADEGHRALALFLRLEAESPGGMFQGIAQYGIRDKRSRAGWLREQQAELEMAVRLLPVSRQSFLRVNIRAFEIGDNQRSWQVLGLVYIRYEGWRR
jgi:hypothetical protein